MKRIFMLLTGISMALTSLAQTDSTRKEADTIRVGNMIIVKNGDEKHSDYDDDDDYPWKKHRYRPSRITTNWGILDLGFSQYNDKTDYAAAIANGYLPAGSTDDMFSLRNGKSVNVNIWAFMQRLSLYKNIINLKYGVGIELNNYRYTQPVKFQDGKNPLAVLDNTKTYTKNKLAADYATIPFMVNFNFTPNRRYGFGFSAGVSAGYLYSSRQKTVTNEDGKQKFHDDFDLEPWKISYIAELALGPVRVYGSYASKSMFKNTLDQTPYTFGLRLSNW